jgi:hypothetical protein
MPGPQRHMDYIISRPQRPQRLECVGENAGQAGLYSTSTVDSKQGWTRMDRYGPSSKKTAARPLSRRSRVKLRSLCTNQEFSRKLPRSTRAASLGTFLSNPLEEKPRPLSGLSSPLLSGLLQIFSTTGGSLLYSYRSPVLLLSCSPALLLPCSPMPAPMPAPAPTPSDVM